MAKYIYLLLALLCSNTISGQNSKKHNTYSNFSGNRGSLNSKLLRTHFVNSSNNLSSRMQNEDNRRLIGWSQYTSTGIVDSLSLNYKEDRTSAFRNCYENLMPNEIRYNPFFMFEHVLSPEIAYDSLFPVTLQAFELLTFDSVQNGVQMDSFYSYGYNYCTDRLGRITYQDLSNAQSYRSISNFLFSTDNKPILFRIYGVSPASLYYIFSKSYDSLSGKKIVDRKQSAGLGVGMDSSIVNYYAYNAAGQLSSIEQVRYELMNEMSSSPRKVMTLSYNASGLPDTLRYFETDTITDMLIANYNGLEVYRSYDHLGRIVTNTVFYVNADYTALSTKDSFAYVNNYPLYAHHSFSEWDIVNNQWQFVSDFTANINIAGNWDTLLYRQYDYISDLWTPTTKGQVTYTAEDLVSAYQLFQWDGTQFLNNYFEKAYFYYETFENCQTGIEDKHKSFPQFTVYPNPSSGTITVGGLNQKVNLTLYNVDGRKMLNASNTNTLNLASLPSGSYWLRVTNHKNEVIGTQQVIKP